MKWNTAVIYHLAQKYLDQAQSLEPHNRPIQHSLAGLARRQALATNNSLLRQRYRDRARNLVMPLLGATAESAYGYHTAAQITLENFRVLRIRGPGFVRSDDREAGS